MNTKKLFSFTLLLTVAILNGCSKENASQQTEKSVATNEKSSSDLCYDKKVALFKKENGEDAPIKYDIIEEWKEECSGKIKKDVSESIMPSALPKISAICNNGYQSKKSYIVTDDQTNTLYFSVNGSEPYVATEHTVNVDYIYSKIRYEDKFVQRGGRSFELKLERKNGKLSYNSGTSIGTVFFDCEPSDNYLDMLNQAREAYKAHIEYVTNFRRAAQDKIDAENRKPNKF